MATMKKVTDSTSKGRSFLPVPGAGGKIPKGTAPSTPKPKAAPQSGSKGKFPAVSHGSDFPFRSNGKSGSSPSVGAAKGLQPKTSVAPMPLRSAKSASK